ncbi:UNVERIFIED_CONTAM: hypothetical protein PYX00_008413 [Menopon gallinae]|uniref:Protein kinase domain-containing protein n=1 Tax=Menopon gallinae TaxID=328185 RepID=A0AAW2HN61_9NEOP
MKSREKRDSTIHGITEVEMEEIQLEDEYEVVKTLGEGYYAQVVLATHKKTGTTVVLKQIHRELTNVKDFFREYHYNYHLSPHPNIVCSYSECFIANNCYTYALEYAACGDLAGKVKAGGLPEDQCKKIARQLTSALEFLHSKKLVHRDIKLENVLVFESNMDRIKLCDFGSTRKEGSLVSRANCTWTSFQPPEVCDVVKNEKYYCQSANDTWQLGVVIFVCLTGCPPWEKADEILDPQYKAFYRWRTRRCIKMPQNFKKFTVRLLRLFRRLFDNKPENRPPVTETLKYLKDSWTISKLSNSSSAPTIPVAGTESCGQEEGGGGAVSNDCKPKPKRTASRYNVETKIDQNVITKRIWEWMSNCESYLDSSYEGI